MVTNQTPRHNPCVLTPSLQPYRATYGCKLTRGLKHRGFYLEGDCPCVLITSLLPYAGRLGSEPRLVGQRWSGVRVSASFYRLMRMHSAEYAVARCLSVRLCHTPVLCLNGYAYPQSFFTAR